MGDPVVCKNCGAMSYNIPGQTTLYCSSCWTKLLDLLKESEWVDSSGDKFCPWCGGSVFRGHRADCPFKCFLAEMRGPNIPCLDCGKAHPQEEECRLDED